MSHFVNAARTAAAASLVCGLACVGPATASADSNSDKLAGMLSRGYSTSNCTPTQVSAALAAFDCKQNSDSSGPSNARYILLADSNDLASEFKASTGLDTLSPCTPGDPVPSGWHYDSSPNSTAGQVACGTYKGTPEVMWTNDKNLMYGDIQGTDLASLYQWWKANG